MKHVKTINWETPESFPDDVIALYFVPNDGNNHEFKPSQVEEFAEYFNHEDGDVFGLIKSNGNGNIKYVWSNTNTWDIFQHR